MTSSESSAFLILLINGGATSSDDEDENDKFIIAQLKASKHLARTCQELHSVRLITRAYLLDTVNWPIGKELLRGPGKYEALEHILEVHYPLHYRELEVYTREVNALQQLLEQRGRELLEMEVLAAANLNEQEHRMVQRGVQDIQHMCQNIDQQWKEEN